MAILAQYQDLPNSQIKDKLWSVDTLQGSGVRGRNNRAEYL